MQSLMIQHRCMLFTFIMGIPSSETIPKPKNTLSATNEKAGQDVEKRHRDPARIRAWVLWIPVRWHGLTNWATVALALSILSTPFRPRCNAKSPTVHDMHVSAWNICPRFARQQRYICGSINHRLNLLQRSGVKRISFSDHASTRYEFKVRSCNACSLL